MVPLAGELQVDAAVLESLPVEPVRQASLAQQPDAAVLDHARALPGLAVGAAAYLHDHRVDAAEREQMGQQQPSRAGPDDAYLRAHVLMLVLVRSVIARRFGGRGILCASRTAVP